MDHVVHDRSPHSPTKEPILGDEWLDPNLLQWATVVPRWALGPRGVVLGAQVQHPHVAMVALPLDTRASQRTSHPELVGAFDIVSESDGAADGPREPLEAATRNAVVTASPVQRRTLANWVRTNITFDYSMEPKWKRIFPFS